MKQNLVKKKESALSLNDSSSDISFIPKQASTTNSSISTSANINSPDSIKAILSNSQNTGSFKDHVETHISKGSSTRIKDNIQIIDVKEELVKATSKKASPKQTSLPYLKVEEIKKLFKKNMPLRDNLILNVLYETGCTVREAVSIKLADIDGTEGLIYINKGKGIKERVSYVSGNLILKVRKFYKSEFDIINIKSEENSSMHLFSTRQSKNITTRRIRQIVKDNCKKIGVSDASPKLLRYTHIVHAYENGMPINLIQKQVGIKKSRAIELFCNLKELSRNTEYRLI